MNALISRLLHSLKQRISSSRIVRFAYTSIPPFEFSESTRIVTIICLLIVAWNVYPIIFNEDGHKQMRIYPLVQIIKPAFKGTLWAKNSKIKYIGDRCFESIVKNKKHCSTFQIKETKINAWSDYPSADFTPADTLTELIPAFGIFQKLYPFEQFLLHDLYLQLPTILQEFCTKFQHTGINPKLTVFPYQQAILKKNFGNYELVLNIAYYNNINSYSFGLIRYSVSPLHTRGTKTLIF